MRSRQEALGEWTLRPGRPVPHLGELRPESCSERDSHSPVMRSRATPLATGALVVDIHKEVGVYDTMFPLPASTLMQLASLPAYLSSRAKVHTPAQRCQAPLSGRRVAALALDELMESPGEQCRNRRAFSRRQHFRLPAARPRAMTGLCSWSACLCSLLLHVNQCSPHMYGR
jgi:hypothetical protein